MARVKSVWVKFLRSTRRSIGRVGGTTKVVYEEGSVHELPDYVADRLIQSGRARPAKKPAGDK